VHEGYVWPRAGLSSLHVRGVSFRVCYLLIDWPFISPWQFTQEGLTFGRSLALYSTKIAPHIMLSVRAS
jgi:hypothetical protein